MHAYYTTLLKANFKRHAGALLGIFSLILIACLSLITAITILINAKTYLTGEMDRLGFGDVTAWVSGVPNMRGLTAELASLPDVTRVQTQPLIHASYSMNGQDSESEGQLVLYEGEQYAYRFFTAGLDGHMQLSGSIKPGEIYLSPAMVSLFGAKIGDKIRFSVARSGGEKSFVVKGFFEDPFMGSSMIGMKSFLIGDRDFDEISHTIEKAHIDALARTGAMVHLFKKAGSPLSIADWSSRLNRLTSLSRFTEFAHSKAAITDFMLLLQHIFAGFLLVFVFALFASALLMLAHTIGSAIRRDTVNLGILKSVGCTSRMLRNLQLMQYVAVIAAGIAMSLLLAFLLIAPVNRITLTTTGILTPDELPAGACALIFAVLLIFFRFFILRKTGRITRIRPLQAIRGTPQPADGKNPPFPLHQKGLVFWLALRQLTSGKRQYVGAMLIAVLLVLLTSMVGRVNSWLGVDGKGLMDAFNPADHDFGVQLFGTTSRAEIEQTISVHSEITDQYVLAMPGVTVNGLDYTANVIDEPERFHIVRGSTALDDDEIVLTETAAADLRADISDTVLVSGVAYTVSGIYQCANDMGANIGMNRAGYAKIGIDSPEIWCIHYFIADTDKKSLIMQNLADTYGGDVHLHENGWPGLNGILSAMQILTVILYVLVSAVILISVLLVSERLIAIERQNLGIYKAMGFKDSVLRIAFMLRFTLSASAGSIFGLVISTLFTDLPVSAVMRLCGISNFSSFADMQNTAVPAAAVIILYTVFSYVACAAIRRVQVRELISE